MLYVTPQLQSLQTALFPDIKYYLHETFPLTISANSFHLQEGRVEVNNEIEGHVCMDVWMFMGVLNWVRRMGKRGRMGNWVVAEGSMGGQNG